MIESRDIIFSFRHTTILRGIAISLIMIQHVGGGWTNLFTPLGGTGVALFLLISGFGINESYYLKGTDMYWIKKILRVFLPYLIFESIFFILQKSEFRVYILDVLCIKTYYWYIGYILRWYLFYYIIVCFAPKYVIKLLLACSIIMFFTSPEIESEQSLSFVFGVFMSKEHRKLKKYYIDSKGLYEIIILAIPIIVLTLKQTSYIRSLEGTSIFNLIQLLIKLPLAIFILTLTYKVTLKFKLNIFHFLGLISYELYLIHMKLIPIIEKKYINIPIFLIISTILSYIFYRYNNVVNKKIIATCRKIKIK